MPRFWVRFYLRQCLLLAASGLVIALLFKGNRLDLLLADPWYDAGAHLWPFREAWWAKDFVHAGFKGALIFVAIACLWMTWRHRRAGDRRRWWVVAAAIIAVPLTVSIWKHYTAMHCPWNIDRYGGAFPYFDLLTAAPFPLPGPGRCFPASFVSAASWLFAFALLRYPEDRRFSHRAGLAALALSLFLGAVQQVRGAHFLSHTLWTLWLSWAIVIALHALLGGWRDVGTMRDAD